MTAVPLERRRSSSIGRLYNRTFALTTPALAGRLAANLAQKELDGRYWARGQLAPGARVDGIRLEVTVNAGDSLALVVTTSATRRAMRPRPISWWRHASRRDARPIATHAAGRALPGWPLR